ncbi:MULTISPECIES: hypothetical protein [unclassified Shinella]|uniref:hypothetical protein n=1 Tax=unclassified Shinella TaxID=2643062 RepID=UPI00225D0DA4|nr:MULTISPECIES: hypothetical protein [unclassified Shinella]MCO5136366.1 hypothetical protein [Shinella sp.]MDC7253959.1 hypothetical protein [Shinella sp. YE25]CAI0336615.1 conserved hypothetical protein [Rhizobiaceae bacterium]CAK7255147.1 conserved protein of unknown function [Shinella sp. WSC3-e]
MITLGSVTDLRPEHAGRAVLVGSHGGHATGEYALAFAIASLMCHDAGIGLEEAGVEGLTVLGNQSVPAIAIDYRSARIGDAQDMLARGRVSRANAPAVALGIFPGSRAADAAALLSDRVGQATALSGATSDAIFRRRECSLGPGRRLVFLDSASSITPFDNGAIIVTGSHGGLPAGAADRAIKARPLIAIFNDAGVGIDTAGIARLPVLDRQGVAAACVKAASARIGDARSTYETGIVSFANEKALALGAQPGTRIRHLIGSLTGIAADQFPTWDT